MTESTDWKISGCSGGAEATAGPLPIEARLAKLEKCVACLCQTLGRNLTTIFAALDTIDDLLVGDASEGSEEETAAPQQTTTPTPWRRRIGDIRTLRTVNLNPRGDAGQEEDAKKEAPDAE